MKLKSDRIKKTILSTAQKEFLQKGFNGTSLRSIAEKANGTTGIIYTYFKNKDELFKQLVQPVTSLLENRLATKVFSFEEAKKEKRINPERWFTQNLHFLLFLIEKYPNEMKLLFLKSEGSSFQGYKEILVQKGIERSITAFRTLKRSKAFEGQELSEFFIGNLVMYVINIAEEILKQNKSRQEVDLFEKEISAFLFSGWKALVKM